MKKKQLFNYGQLRESLSSEYDDLMIVLLDKPIFILREPVLWLFSVNMM